MSWPRLPAGLVAAAGGGGAAAGVGEGGRTRESRSCGSHNMRGFVGLQGRGRGGVSRLRLGTGPAGVGDLAEGGTGIPGVCVAPLWKPGVLSAPVEHHAQDVTCRLTPPASAPWAQEHRPFLSLVGATAVPSRPSVPSGICEMLEGWFSVTGRRQAFLPAPTPCREKPAASTAPPLELPASDPALPRVTVTLLSTSQSALGLLLQLPPGAPSLHLLLSFLVLLADAGLLRDQP